MKAPGFEGEMRTAGVGGAEDEGSSTIVVGFTGATVLFVVPVVPVALPLLGLAALKDRVLLTMGGFAGFTESKFCVLARRCGVWAEDSFDVVPRIGALELALGPEGATRVAEGAAMLLVPREAGCDEELPTEEFEDDFSMRLAPFAVPVEV